MSAEGRIAYAFGPFRLLPAERRLEAAGRTVRIGGRAFDLLICLVGQAGEIVSSRTLISEAWRGVSIEESSLRAHIRALRQALAKHDPGAEYVANVPGRGYCLVAPVERISRVETPPSSNSDPADRTATIVGRSNSLAAIRRELSKRRLVTIVGPAGVGKTTVAIAAAQAMGADIADLTYFIDLAPVGAPTLAVSALAAVLGVTLREVDPLQEIVQFLRGRRALIVLDNCEQVIEAVAAIVDRLLRDTQEPRVLATSREPLRIPDERVHRLPPLDCPPSREGITAEEAMAYAAIQLFVDRAASNCGFVLDDKNAAVVAEICRRLDGIPLAIELAAARVEFFGVGGLARRLNDMFAVLTQGRRFAVPRHQTLRATLDWGYQLLSPFEQAALRRIGVFRSNFTLDAALAVVIDDALLYENAVEALANLTAKSLLTAQGAGDLVRYRLLEATRLYASEKLADSEDARSTALRHAQYHLGLLQSGQDDRDRGSGWLSRCAACLDDIRGALEWALSPSGDQPVGLDLMAASAQLWFQLSLNLEHRARIERVVQALPPDADPLVETRLLIALGHAYWYTSSGAAMTEPAFARALELCDKVGNIQIQYRLQALWGMWASRRAQGRYQEALGFAQAYEAAAQVAADPSFQLLGERILGLTWHYLGDQMAAQRLAEHVRSVARRARTLRNTDLQLGPEVAAAALLPRIFWLQGRPDQAQAALDEAIEIARRADNWFSLYYVLGLAGCPLSLWLGNLAATARYLNLMVNRSASDIWLQCWTFVLRLRNGTSEETLLAAFLEPRLDLSTFSQALDLAKGPLTVPAPDEAVGDALWSLPEVLRVNAELLLRRGGVRATEEAESSLMRSLDLARRQSAQSWELRAATSLARLWRDHGRAPKARDLLSAAYDKFTEGFDSADLIAARALINELA
jgi:predicted ATPase/DNA-binding winged helix-turn-helix (wHTH) protein